MNTKMAAHAAHNCTQNFIFLKNNYLLLLSLCAKRKFCVQNALFVCKTRCCVQTVCKLVHTVCNIVGLCAVCACTDFQCVTKMCAVVCICVQYFSRARTREEVKNGADAPRAGPLAEKKATKHP